MQYRLKVSLSPYSGLIFLIALFFGASVFAGPNLPDPAYTPRLETQPAPPIINAPEIKDKEDRAYPQPLKTESDIQVTIQRIQFIGNKNIDDTSLNSILRDYLDKSIGIKELNKMTALITRYYRQQGYMLAEAYLPEQDIAKNTLQIAVVEGYLGELKLNTKGKLDEAFFKKMAANHLDNNVAIRELNLVKNITLINSLPGVNAVSELAPGKDVGYSDIAIEIEAEPQVTGYIAANTFGNRFTSREAIAVGVFLNNLAGRGDRLGLNVKDSRRERQRTIQLGYILPISETGTLLNLNLGYSDYRLGGEFSSLGATGNSAFVSAFLDQPVLRSRQGNLTSRVGFSYKNLNDDVSAFSLENQRHIKALELGLFGDWRDAHWNGFNQLGLNFKLADVKFKNALAATLDATGAETAGDFVKYNLFGSRIQPLSQNFNLTMRAEYQGVSKNLDSAEKLAIGGINRWREFGELPTSSDRGLIIGAEIRKSPFPITGLAKFLPIFNGAELSPYVFYDEGRGILNHSALSDDNKVRSSHVGLGIDVLLAKKWALDVVFSHQNSRIEGVDAERETRLWGQILKEF